MIKEDIELGTRRSAVESFANLMAAAIDVPEVLLHYWLDCYYQLRRAYEAERMAETPAVEITERVAAQPLEQIKPHPASISFTGKKASMKQETYTKLLAARAKGITFSELSQSTNYMLSEGDVMSMLNAQPMTDRKWEIMAGALNDLEKQGRIGQSGGS